MQLMDDVILVAVSDDRFKRKNGEYRKTQQKIKYIFEKNPNFGITKNLFLDWEDIIKTEFYQDNKVLLDNEDPAINGRAYKPYIIKEGLSKIKEGDFLIYNDSSPEIWNFDENIILDNNIYDINIIKNLCVKNGGVLTAFCYHEDPKVDPYKKIGHHTHKNFTTERCMSFMGLSQYRDSLQHASGMVILQKSQKSINFINEWLYYNCIEDCASLGKIDIPNDASIWVEEVANFNKRGHRHDQSISGLLINKMNNNLINLPEKWIGTPYNFINYCQKNINYSFINSNQV